MLSLYVHIPFCQSKCSYCAFSTFSMEEKSDQVQDYLSLLEKEMAFYASKLNDKSLKTLYIWGGTPNLIWSDNLIKIIEAAEKHFDMENLAELSFEFNPYPEQEIYDIIRKLQARFAKKYPRIRFSFGIQSFDNEVLTLSGRKSLFLGLVDFLRGLQPLKTDSTVFNFDFIAFGKRNTTKKGNRQLRNQPALTFFQNFVNSQFADSFSLYTLELFENQLWKKKNEKLISGEFFGTDEDIYEEFSLLKDILLDAGYSRYELSNFSLASKSSIHNRVYREMEDYIGIWLNSASFLNAKNLNPDLLSAFNLSDFDWKALRFKNTISFDQYCKGDFLDPKAFEVLNQQDYLIESFFLGLRTDRGVRNLEHFAPILVPNYLEKITSYQEQGFVTYNEETQHLQLTDAGMDVFNAIVTDIMAEI